MKKILVIGSLGSLGQEITKVFSDMNPIGLTQNDLDITSKSAVLEKIVALKPDVVINCSAYNAVDQAEEEPEIAKSVNGYGVGYIAQACEQVGAILVHYSTNYVFDGHNQHGYAEHDEPNPLGMYGKSKLLGEIEAQKASKNYVVRTAWLYGLPGIGANVKKNFVYTMLDLAKQKPKIECVNDQFGNPTYTKDVAQATRALLEMNKPYGIYHFINDGVASWYTWAKEIFRIKHVKIELADVYVQNQSLPAHKVKRPQYATLLNTKFIKLRPWPEALEEFLNSN